MLDGCLEVIVYCISCLLARRMPSERRGERVLRRQRLPGIMNGYLLQIITPPQERGDTITNVCSCLSEVKPVLSVQTSPRHDSLAECFNLFSSNGPERLTPMRLRISIADTDQRPAPIPTFSGVLWLRHFDSANSLRFFDLLSRTTEFHQ